MPGRAKRAAIELHQNRATVAVVLASHIVGRREGSHENARQIRAGRRGPAGSTYLFSGPTCDRNFSSGAECACERSSCCIARRCERMLEIDAGSGRGVKAASPAGANAGANANCRFCGE